jgi:pimeloyl-ACP methyl ester carboxylesterase
VEREVGQPLDVIDEPGITAAVGDTPVLVVHDRDDRFIAFEQGQRLRSALPAAKLHETSGLGHGRLLADRGVITRILDFVSDGA